MNVETVTAIIAALGGAAIIPKIVDGVKAWRSGKAAEERRENRSALGQLLAERDYVFRVEEWGGRLVYMLTQLGARDIPAKPERKAKVNS